MIDIEKISNSVPRSEAEYIGQDGLLHCKQCGDPVETVITVPIVGERKVRCICTCRKKVLNADKERARLEELDRSRRICFDKSAMMECTFQTSDETQHMQLAKNYVKNFPEFIKQGKGLLAYGPCGTGKSHMAACIANALIDDGYKVKMTNFETMVNILQSSFDGRQEFIDSLKRYALLIIDDLGAERKSDYMQGQVYNIIDARYRSGLPMIITTNLTGDEFSKAEDIGNIRIYDRILERCHPVKFEGQSIRRQKLREDYKQTELLLKGE